MFYFTESAMPRSLVPDENRRRNIRSTYSLPLALVAFILVILAYPRAVTYAQIFPPDAITITGTSSTVTDKQILANPGTITILNARLIVKANTEASITCGQLRNSQLIVSTVSAGTVAAAPEFLMNYECKSQPINITNQTSDSFWALVYIPREFGTSTIYTIPNNASTTQAILDTLNQIKTFASSTATSTLTTATTTANANLFLNSIATSTNALLNVLSSFASTGITIASATVNQASTTQIIYNFNTYQVILLIILVGLAGFQFLRVFFSKRVL